MGLKLIESQCDFIQHCRDNAATLSEHDWYAMITNLVPFQGGIAKVHALSKDYHAYTEQETDSKISHFQKSGTGPMTCKIIAEKGYQCPKLKSGECTCKSPASLAYLPPSFDGIKVLADTLEVSISEMDNLQTVRHFIEEYLFSLDVISANAVISHLLKEKFHFKQADVKPLLQYHKEIYRKFEAAKRSKEHRRSSAQIPSWYEATERGLKFLPDILAADMAKNTAAFYAAEQYYRYEHGVYSEISELDAKNMVREKMLPGNTKLSQISDAEGQWRMQIQRDVRELNANPYIINVRNGLYNVLENKLTEHNSEYLSTVQLAVDYTPGADCPRFKQFLHEALDDEQVLLIQEMLGYFLIPVNRAQKSFVIVGEAGAGKSKLLLVLNDILLGKENVSNVSWQSLNERFKTAELFGKLANIFADLPTKNIDDNGIFKALVGEDYLTVERKNKNPFSFQPYARLLFSCNKIPRNYGDKSEGFYRRLIIVRFNHAVPEEKRDPDLLEKFRMESDGIFLFALEGLRRLMNNHFKFSETQANAQELQKYREDSNSVLSFVKECCEISVDGEVSRTELFNRYKEYCTDAGLAPFAQRNFNAELENNFPSVHKATDKLGKTAISTVMYTIHSVITTVWNAISGFISGILNSIWSVISSIWNSISSTVSSVLNAISSVVSNVWNTIKTTISNVMNSIKSTISNIWDSIKSAISSKISGIVDTVKSGFNTAVNFVKGLASDAWNWGRDIISGIVDGIKSCINWISDACTNIADTIRSYLHFSVPDVGPLTDFESWMPDFMKGLADGINKSKKVVAKAVSGVADTMEISLNSDLSYKLDGISGAVINGGSESSVVNNYYQNDNSRTVNQTNNSPKSLSRLEIYRLTRNALKT